MDQDKQYIEILTKLAEISSDVKGMHRRQDITNGRIAKNEEKVIELEKTNISILDKLSGLEKRNSDRDEAEKAEAVKRDGSKTFWFRQIAERVLWVVVAIIGVILTKLGIINISI